MPSIEDWAAKAARKILSDSSCPSCSSARVECDRCSDRFELPTKERVAAVIAMFAEPLVSLLREAHNGHHSRGYHDESCDYPPCPKSEGDADEDEKCTCGADAWNARVEKALR